MARAGESGDGIAGLSLRRPVLALAANLLIVLAGLAALAGIEVRELPNIDSPVVTIRADFPGATPETVDAEATRVLERSAARVAGVTSIESASEEGNLRIRVTFRPEADLSAAAADLRDAVSQVVTDLPEGVEDLRVIKSDADAEPILQIAVWSDRHRADELTRFVKDAVATELTTVPGVADVRFLGERDRVVRVEVSPDRLAAYGLSIGEVAEVMRGAQFDVPVGSFSSEALEIMVRADATVSDPASIADLMVRDPVRLGDVASVTFGPDEPTSIVRFDGREVIAVSVIRQPGANTIAISDGVRAAIDGLEGRLPGVGLAIVSDEALFVRGAVAEVLVSLGLALVIVVAVIWVFLGSLSATLVPALTMPVALIGGLAAIWLLGFSINLITLLALVLATGLVVDDAIVVLESIQRRRSEGAGPRAAALIGTRQVFFAVIATTLTLMAVFVPISLLPGEAGRLFREFGVVLAITVSISSFVALTLCPVVAARLPGLGTPPPGVLRWVGRAGVWLYALVLRPMIAAPLVAVTLAGLAVAGAVALYADLGNELVPQEDRGVVIVGLIAPEGSGLDRLDPFVEQAEAMLAPWRETGDALGVLAMTGRWDPVIGWIELPLVPWHQRSTTPFDVGADVGPRLDEMIGVQNWVSYGNSLGIRGGSNRLRIAITGPSHAEIAPHARRLAEEMEARIAGVGRVEVRYTPTQPQLSLAIDRVAASDLAVPMTTLSETLRALVDRQEVGELTVGDTSLPVYLSAPEGTLRDPSDLLNLFVRSENGRLVPLGQLVGFDETGVAAELKRFGQRRAIELRARLDAGVSLGSVAAEAQTIAREILPEAYGLIPLGEAATLADAERGIAITFMLALLVVFLVLAAQFESFVSAGIVMVTVPLGICAAVYALWLTGTTINVYSQIGVLMLVGIMAKNGILLVEVADQLRDRGLSAADAAMQAARLRLRPIAMTLASTVLAGLPLVLGSGAGAEARAAIGWVVFGGLGLAAVFTLFLTPAVYALLAPLTRPRAHEAERLSGEMAALRAPASPAE